MQCRAVNLGFLLGVAVAVMLAEQLSRLWNPVLSWFLGGALIGPSAQLFRAPQEKRGAARMALAVAVTGAVTALAVYLVELVGWT